MIMRGLAVNTVGIMIIALIGVSVLLLFISGSLSSMVNDALCYFSSLMGISTKFCKSPASSSKIVELNVSSQEDLARCLAAYSILCWQKANKPLKKKNMVCYQLSIKKPVGKVSEYNLTKLMEEENGCEELQNSVIVDENGSEIEYPGYCGTRDEIRWDVADTIIENQSLILIEYDTKENQIVIKC